LVRTLCGGEHKIVLIGGTSWHVTDDDNDDDDDDDDGN